MPTVRRRVAHVKVAPGPLETEHAGTGRDHLLGGPCRYCGNGWTRGDWVGVREAVLRDWQALGMPFPPLGALLFDGEKLPPLDPRWRDLHRSTWRAIAAELRVAE